MLTITCDDQAIHMEQGGTTVASLPLSLHAVFLLDKVFAHLKGMGFFTGQVRVVFTWSGKEAVPGLRKELLLQLLALCTVYNTYPVISDKSPFQPEQNREDFEHHLHSVANLAVFAELCHCQTLGGYAAGRPVVLVAPGPTIDFELLRELSGRAVVLAVGRVLPRLLKEGITPDFLYVQETTAKGWEAIFGPDDGTVLDMALIANPVGPIHAYLQRVKRGYKAWNFYFPHETDVMPKIEEIAPSSTTGAYSIARMLGADSILFMGCDCGSPVQTSSLDFVQAAYPVEDMLGAGQLPVEPFCDLAWLLVDMSAGTVLTKGDYIACSQWLKTRMFLGQGEQAPRHYDNSWTGLIRGDGLAQPYPERFDFPSFDKPDLPSYDTGFDPEPILKRHLGRYSFIRRHLERSRTTPEASLPRPYNCIYADLKRWTAKPLELEDGELAQVLARLDVLTAAAQKAAENFKD